MISHDVSGSPRYRTCLEKFAFESGHESCLANLYFRHSVEALQGCETEQIILPSTEKTEHSGYGAWLLTSGTTAYTLYESDIDSTTSSGLKKIRDADIASSPLKCGKQISGPHIKI